MKKHLLIFLSIFVHAGYTQTDAVKAARIDSVFQLYTSKNMFSGSVLIAKKGKVLLSKGYGMANYSYEVPNASSTKFKLASMSKQFTAMAIMILQEKGKINLDDKLTKYISNYPNGDKITIHHLLTHTSGIPSYNELNRSFLDSIFGIPHTLEQIIAITKNKALEFEPGSKFKYCNSGYILLTYIIEKSSGKKYGDYIKETIFDPLGMKNSGLHNNKEILKNMADGYIEVNNKLEHCKYMDMSFASGAGGLYSTVEDLFLWERSFYTEKLVKKATLEKVVTPFKDVYAYGWMVDKYLDHKWIYHAGYVFGFSGIISRFPDDELCIIILRNVENYMAFGGHFFCRATMFDQPCILPTIRKIANVDKKIYQKLTGEYELQPGFILTVTTDGNQIFSQAADQDKNEIYPESDYNYFLKAVDAQIQFIKNEKGDVISLIFLQGENKMLGKKIK
ncbi:MAG: serine hydrolase [Bacteroidia bacterium]